MRSERWYPRIVNIDTYKGAWWFVAVVGVVLTAGGVFGVWFRGWIYEGGFPTSATVGEVRAAFTLPAAVTAAGSLTVAAVLMASPLTAAWTPTRRLGAFICFVVLVLVACTVCGHLAGFPCREDSKLN